MGLSFHLCILFIFIRRDPYYVTGSALKWASSPKYHLTLTLLVQSTAEVSASTPILYIYYSVVLNEFLKITFEKLN